MKKGDDEEHPQRDRYVMERQIKDQFEGGEGKKRGGETESYSLNDREEEGERGQ